MNSLIKENKLVIVAASLLSAAALSMPGTIVEERGFVNMLIGEVDGVGLLSLIVFVALIVWYQKTWDFFSGHKHWVIYVLAVLFSIFTLIGKSYSRLGNWDFIFYNKRQFLIALIAFAGYFILYETCICALFRFMDSKKTSFYCTDSEPAGFLQKIERHYFLSAFIVISICWLPYLLLFLPGSVPHDGYYQINMAFGINELSNSHPWMVTMFIGALMRIGRIISDNFGVFLIVVTLFIVEALCYSFICYKIKQWKAPRIFNMSVLLFFALIPVFGTYAQAVLKDGIFTAFFALFIVLYVECCLSCLNMIPKINIKKSLCFLFIIGFLVCLTRNNCIYMAILIDILLLFFFDKREKKYVLLLVAALIVSYYGINVRLASTMSVEPSSMRESLSVPFQQTARYLKEYPDDVTDEEAEAIAEVLAYEQLAELYDPEVSDYVKNTFHLNEESKKQGLTAYFKAWSAMFKRHPGVYLEATIHNTYAYYYPFYNFSKLVPYQLYIKGEPVATGDFDIHYVMPERIRNWMGGYALAWRNIPGLAQLVNPGFYSWVLLLLCGYTIYCRHYKRLLLYAAPLLNVVVCIASPVNGLVRYAMPLMACTPVLIFWCFISTRKE